MGREIESRQGKGWQFFLNLKLTFQLIQLTFTHFNLLANISLILDQDVFKQKLNRAITEAICKRCIFERSKPFAWNRDFCSNINHCRLIPGTDVMILKIIFAKKLAKIAENYHHNIDLCFHHDRRNFFNLVCY
jgi:hypothetical protein